MFLARRLIPIIFSDNVRYLTLNWGFHTVAPPPQKNENSVSQPEKLISVSLKRSILANERQVFFHG